MLNVFTNVNLKDIKLKIFLHMIGLLVLHPIEFLILLQHLALFILTVILLMFLIQLAAVGISCNMLGRQVKKKNK